MSRSMIPLVVLFTFMSLPACGVNPGAAGGEEVAAVLDGDEATDPGAAEVTVAAPLGRDLPGRIARADQILHGTVLDLQYATSEDLGEQTSSFPHTFVTVRVDTPILGGEAGDEVTLRFGGGPTGDGRILKISDIPLFGIGDEVVLVVADNGETACPLVDCADGLVRLSGGKAYDAGGVALSLNADGQLYAGQRYAIPEATSFAIGDSQVGLVPDGALPVRPDVTALSTHEMVSWLGARVAERVEPGEIAARPSTISLDPAQPFLIPHPGNARPVLPAASTPEIGEQTDEDRAEIAALIANDHNPVLPRR